MSKILKLDLTNISKESFMDCIEIPTMLPCTHYLKARWDSCKNDRVHTQYLWVTINLTSHPDADEEEECEVTFEPIPANKVPRFHLSPAGRRRIQRYLLKEDINTIFESEVMRLLVIKTAKFRLIKDQRGECFVEMKIGKLTLRSREEIDDYFVPETFDESDQSI